MKNALSAGQLSLFALPSAQEARKSRAVPLQAAIDANENPVLFYRQNPDAIPDDVRRAIKSFAVILDGSNKAIKQADDAWLASKYPEWKGLFLATRNSGRTVKTYEKAIERLEAFCEEEGLSPALLKYDDAKRFIASECFNFNQRTGDELSLESKRTTLRAVSSLYTELVKMSGGKICNVFYREQFGLPKRNDAIKKYLTPTPEEVAACIACAEKPCARAAIAVMAYRGLRIGALPPLRLYEDGNVVMFMTTTKGAEQKGVMPKEAVAAIEQAGLSRKMPFGGVNADTLKMRITRELDKLAEKGIIPWHSTARIINHKPKKAIVADYSCHSFRHFYAAEEYKKSHDIEKLRCLLNHDCIVATQVYLRSLGLWEEASPASPPPDR